MTSCGRAVKLPWSYLVSSGFYQIHTAQEKERDGFDSQPTNQHPFLIQAIQDTFKIPQKSFFL